MFHDYLEILKNQSAFYNHDQYHVSLMSIKQFEILFKTQCTKVKNQKIRALLKWTKNNLKLLQLLLDAVRGKFPETQGFIDSTLKEEYEKEKMNAVEVVYCF